MSPEFNNPDKELNATKRAVVLIQGTGEVRAGIWARSVCVNENFEKGSMLPFIEKCKSQGIPVLVMNPNYQKDPVSGETIHFSNNMETHAAYVW